MQILYKFICLWCKKENDAIWPLVLSPEKFVLEFGFLDSTLWWWGRLVMLIDYCKYCSNDIIQATGRRCRGYRRIVARRRYDPKRTYHSTCKYIWRDVVVCWCLKSGARLSRGSSAAPFDRQIGKWAAQKMASWMSRSLKLYGVIEYTLDPYAEAEGDPESDNSINCV